jgi:hypothetical protein
MKKRVVALGVCERRSVLSCIIILIVESSSILLARVYGHKLYKTHHVPVVPCHFPASFTALLQYVFSLVPEVVSSFWPLVHRQRVSILQLVDASIASIFSTPKTVKAHRGFISNDLFYGCFPITCKEPGGHVVLLYSSLQCNLCPTTDLKCCRECFLPSLCDYIVLLKTLQLSSCVLMHTINYCCYFYYF